MAHLPTTAGVEGDTDLRATVLVKGSACVGDILTGNDRGILQYRAGRRVAEGEALTERAVGLKAKLEIGSFTDDAFRLGGVLHPRQLDNNAVFTLPRDQRLGDAELIDAIAQRGEVLFQGIFLEVF